MGGSAAVAWSGGKDSTLALHRALESGHRVTHLFNLVEESTGLVRFHGVPAPWIRAQAGALELALVQGASGEDGFEAAFSRVLDRLRGAGVRTVLFGNVHLADVREWYETRTTTRGFAHEEPLWGEDPGALVREFLDLGYRTLVTSVHLELGDPAWLGRELDAGLLGAIEAREGCDPCGERGEYHTFAFDGPRFATPLPVEPDAVGRDTREREGHRYLLFPPPPPSVGPSAERGAGPVGKGAEPD